MFGRGVGDGPQVLGVGLLVGVPAARDAEVDQEYIVFVCHHDIAGLEIAQDDGGRACMDIGQGLADHHHPANHGVFVKGGIRSFEDFFETATRHKFHDEVVASPFLKIEDE